MFDEKTLKAIEKGELVLPDGTVAKWDAKENAFVYVDPKTGKKVFITV